MEYPVHDLPQPQGLYDPRFEHDACGVAFVADLQGRASNDIVTSALNALRCLQHRGATNAEPNTGGGKTEKKSCPDPEHYGKTLPADTVWTTRTSTGVLVNQYKCNGKTGEWDKVKVFTTPNTRTETAPTGGAAAVR